MGCKPKCVETASLNGPGGKRIMVSQGNAKFKKGEPHPRCDDCEKEYAEWVELMLLFNNDEGKVERYLEMKKKAKEVKQNEKQ